MLILVGKITFHSHWNLSSLSQATEKKKLQTEYECGSESYSSRPIHLNQRLKGGEVLGNVNYWMAHTAHPIIIILATQASV